MGQILFTLSLTTEQTIFILALLLAGQGICHGYHYQRGQTGGWQDVWCEHLFKIGSKLQACQETVSDPADLLLSMKKLPILGKQSKILYIFKIIFLETAEEGEKQSIEIEPKY